MSKLIWNYVKPLNQVNSVEQFEQTYQVVFPDDLKEIIKTFNNGRPSLKVFDIGTLKEREFKKLLSFNQEDMENIYDFLNLDSNQVGFIAFANDPAGNLIGLYNGKIYYWLHESDELLFLADTFTQFLDTLYDF